MTGRSAKLAILGLVLLTAWFRLWRLNETPPGLWFDEGFNGMEVAWMLKTQNWPIFILGGQGREVLFFYLLALLSSLGGEKVYVLRLASAWLGILSIPLMYRWALAVFKKEPAGTGVALISAAGLAVSFWLQVMNRVSYRANTLLPVLLLTGYFFWRGWQSGKLRYYWLAGVGLGLCQYTYLAGRLAPLIFVTFVCGQAALNWKNERARLKVAGPGLLIMVAVAALMFTPMLSVFTRYPELFWERSGDVALALNETNEGAASLPYHVLAALRVFVDGEDPNWRHHLPGRPVLEWFSTLGFWAGLVALASRFRRPVPWFLLSTLLVMWLPALLAEPAFHTLRLVGVTPVYYVSMALGWLMIARWLSARLPIRLTAARAAGGLLALVLLLNGGTTYYDYFWRWAELPEVYQAFETPLAELAGYLASPETGTNFIIPYYLYAHASMRYGLHQAFKEAVLLPEAVAASLRQAEKVSIVMPEYPPDDSLPPAWVWLVKEGDRAGVAYVSAVQRDNPLASFFSAPAPAIKDSRGQVMARLYPVDPEKALFLFPSHLPSKKAATAWADNLLLTGYEFTPATVEAGAAGQLLLAWKLLSYTGLEEKMFFQLLDSRGQPVGQQEVEPISRKMYRWRDEGLVLDALFFRLEAGLPAGLYFARLGFFNPQTGQRLPAFSPTRQPLGDELIVGPLYVTANGVDPLRPQYAAAARLGQEIALLGYSLTPVEAGQATQVKLYWQSQAPVETNYTVFVQLLDEQNQVVAQADAQPLPNLYPTSRWQPGDIISDQFVLPVAGPELLQGGRLVTGMYDLTTGARLPVYDQQGDLLPDGLVQLAGQ